MMPVVRISDELFERLQRHAVPLVDSFGDVLDRILNEYEELKRERGSSQRATPDHKPASPTSISGATRSVNGERADVEELHTLDFVFTHRKPVAYWFDGKR